MGAVLRTTGGLLLMAYLFQATIAAPVYEDGQALDSQTPGDGCYYNFEHYEEGDRILTNEPCLNCTCANKMLMCYLRVCPFTRAIGQDCTIEKKPDQCCPVITCPQVPVALLTSSTTTAPSTTTALGRPDNYGCTLEDNTFYADGAQVPSDPKRPCELCYCIRNHTTCVMQECTLKVAGCTPVYQEGVCCPVRYDCDYEEALTTPKPTPGQLTTTSGAPLCQGVNGTIHHDGELIENYSANPCERCYCMLGSIVCAVQECGSPMEGTNCKPIGPLEGECCPSSYECENGIVPATSLGKKPTPEESDQTKDEASSEENGGESGSPEKVPEKVDDSSASDSEPSEENEKAPEEFVYSQGLDTKPVEPVDQTEQPSESEPTHTENLDDKSEVENRPEVEVSSETGSPQEATSESSSHLPENSEHTSEAAETVSEESQPDISENLHSLQETTPGSVKEESVTDKPSESVQEAVDNLTSPENEVHPDHPSQFSDESESVVTVLPSVHDGEHFPTTTPSQYTEISVENVEMNTSPPEVSQPLPEETASEGEKEHEVGNKPEETLSERPIESSESLPSETAELEKHVPQSDPLATNEIPESPTAGTSSDNSVLPSEPEAIESPRIPGEGSCLIDGKTYAPDSEVPTFNGCQKVCYCRNSIVECKHIECPPPPSATYANCIPIETPDSCCPTYMCDQKPSDAPEIQNQLSIDKIDTNLDENGNAAPEEPLEETWESTTQRAVDEQTVLPVVLGIPPENLVPGTDEGHSQPEEHPGNKLNEDIPSLIGAQPAFHGGSDTLSAEGNIPVVIPQKNDLPLDNQDASKVEDSAEQTDVDVQTTDKTLDEVSSQNVPEGGVLAQEETEPEHHDSHPAETEVDTAHENSQFPSEETTEVSGDSVPEGNESFSSTLSPPEENHDGHPNEIEQPQIPLTGNEESDLGIKVEDTEQTSTETVSEHESTEPTNQSHVEHDDSTGQHSVDSTAQHSVDSLAQGEEQVPLSQTTEEAGKNEDKVTTHAPDVQESVDTSVGTSDEPVVNEINNEKEPEDHSVLPAQTEDEAEEQQENKGEHAEEESAQIGDHITEEQGSDVETTTKPEHILPEDESKHTDTQLSHDGQETAEAGMKEELERVTDGPQETESSTVLDRSDNNQFPQEESSSSLPPADVDNEQPLVTPGPEDTFSHVLSNENVAHFPGPEGISSEGPLDQTDVTSEGPSAVSESEQEPAKDNLPLSNENDVDTITSENTDESKAPVEEDSQAEGNEIQSHDVLPQENEVQNEINNDPLKENTENLVPQSNGNEPVDVTEHIDGLNEEKLSTTPLPETENNSSPSQPSEDGQSNVDEQTDKETESPHQENSENSQFSTDEISEVSHDGGETTVPVLHEENESTSPEEVPSPDHEDHSSAPQDETVTENLESSPHLPELQGQEETEAQPSAVSDTESESQNNEEKLEFTTPQSEKDSVQEISHDELPLEATSEESHSEGTEQPIKETETSQETTPHTETVEQTETHHDEHPEEASKVEQERPLEFHTESDATNEFHHETSTELNHENKVTENEQKETDSDMSPANDSQPQGTLYEENSTEGHQQEENENETAQAELPQEETNIGENVPTYQPHSENHQEEGTTHKVEIHPEEPTLTLTPIAELPHSQETPTDHHPASEEMEKHEEILENEKETEVQPHVPETVVTHVYDSDSPVQPSIENQVLDTTVTPVEEEQKENVKPEGESSTGEVQPESDAVPAEESHVSVPSEQSSQPTENPPEENSSQNLDEQHSLEEQGTLEEKPVPVEHSTETEQQIPEKEHVFEEHSTEHISAEEEHKQVQPSSDLEDNIAEGSQTNEEEHVPISQDHEPEEHQSVDEEHVTTESHTQQQPETSSEHQQEITEEEHQEMPEVNQGEHQSEIPPEDRFSEMTTEAHVQMPVETHFETQPESHSPEHETAVSSDSQAEVTEAEQSLHFGDAVESHSNVPPVQSQSTVTDESQPESPVKVEPESQTESQVLTEFQPEVPVVSQDSQPESISESQSEVSSESHQEFLPEHHPEVAAESEPEVPTESQPEVSSESQNGFPSEPHFEIPSESQPEIPAESQPEVPSETHLGFPPELQPEVPTESQPEIPTESHPEVPIESQPEVSSETHDGFPPPPPQPEVPTESQPEVPAESHPELSPESHSEVPAESQTEVQAESHPEVPSESHQVPSESHHDFPPEPHAEVPAEFQPEVPAESQSEVPAESQSELSSESHHEFPPEPHHEFSPEPHPEVSTESNAAEPQPQVPTESNPEESIDQHPGTQSESEEQFNYHAPGEPQLIPEEIPEVHPEVSSEAQEETQTESHEAPTASESESPPVQAQIDIIVDSHSETPAETQTEAPLGEPNSEEVPSQIATESDVEHPLQPVPEIYAQPESTPEVEHPPESPSLFPVGEGGEHPQPQEEHHSETPDVETPVSTSQAPVTESTKLTDGETTSSQQEVNQQTSEESKPEPHPVLHNEQVDSEIGASDKDHVTDVHHPVDQNQVLDASTPPPFVYPPSTEHPHLSHHQPHVPLSGSHVEVPPLFPNWSQKPFEHQTEAPHHPEDPHYPSGFDQDYEDDDGASYGPGTCRYGGKVYLSAQQIPRDDPCDFCFCFRSDIICLQQSCPPPIKGCYQETIKGFCCPRYECHVSMATMLNITTTTTTTTTTLPPHFFAHAYKGAATREGCVVKGVAYSVGDRIPSTSGPCLECRCGANGQMKCDPTVCGPQEALLRQVMDAAAVSRR